MTDRELVALMAAVEAMTPRDREIWTLARTAVNEMG